MLRTKRTSNLRMPTMTKWLTLSMLVLHTAVLPLFPGKCASAAAQTLANHPRFVTPTRLTALRTAAANNTVQWTKLKQAADAALSGTQPTGVSNLRNLALVFIITGDTRYSACAIQGMNAQTAQATGAANVSNDSWYEIRTTFPGVAAVYDGCYAQMSPSEKSTAATWMMNNADACWARPSGWSINNPQNNYFYGFEYTGMAGLAVGADEPRAAGYITKWLSDLNLKITPVLQGTSAGGYFIEGTNYDKYDIANLAWQVDAYQSATGANLTSGTPVGTFLANSAYYSIHSTTPDLLLYWPVGDQSRQSMPSITDYDRDRILAASYLVGGATQSDAKFWLNSVKQPAWNWRYWSEFQYFQGTATAAPTPTDYRLTQPLNFFAAGPGAFLNRTSWGTAADLFGIQCGAQNESHSDDNSNGFQIWRGGSFLTASNNQWSASGINETTINHNNVTLSGKGQWQAGAGGVTSIHENGTDYMLFQGNAAPQYKERVNVGGNWIINSLASDATRKVVEVQSGANEIFVISDRLTKPTTGIATEFHLHSKLIPTVSGSTFSWVNAGAELHGTNLLPVSTTVGFVPENLGSAGALSSYRTDVVAPTGALTDQMLNVLQVTPLSGTVATPTSTPTSSTHLGTQVGAWVILLGKTDSVTGNVTYSWDGTGATEHVVANLAPSTSYGVATSSSQGTLRFHENAGTSTITLIPNGTPPPPPPPPPTPVLTTIVLVPTSASLAVSATQQFTATGLDQSGNPIAATISWSATGGTVNGSGLYTAGGTTGSSFAVTATNTASGVTASAPITITSSGTNYQTLYNNLLVSYNALLAKINALITYLQNAPGFPTFPFP